jgi:hypothetical protein
MARCLAKSHGIFLTMSNLKIGLRIAIALLLPLLGMLGFSSYVVIEKSRIAAETERLTTLVH